MAKRKMKSEIVKIDRCDLCNNKMTIYDYFGLCNVKVCMSCALADMSAFNTLINLISGAS